MTDTVPTMLVDTNLIPPEGDPKVGRKVFEILDEILTYKESLGLPEKWNRAYELTKNRHWKKTTKKASLVTANLCFKHRQRTTNMLTDNNPTFNISKAGMEEGKEEFYDKLLRLSEYWWRDTEQQHILEKSVARCEENGACVEKVVFDPEREYGLGEVTTEIIPLYNVGFYPTTQSDNIQQKEAVLIFRPMSIREAMRRWPDKAKEIKPDQEILAKINDNREEIIAKSKGLKGTFTNYGTTIKKLMNSFGMAQDEGDECMIVECWCKDYTTVTEDVTESVAIEGDVEAGAAAETVETYTRPKYKGFIRCVTACNGGELVLSDRDNPSINPNLPEEKAINTYLYDKIPVNHTVSCEDTASDWGISDYEQLEGLMMEVNKTLSQLTLVKDKAARLKLINPRTSGVENSEFTNAPGIIRPNDEQVAAGIRYLEAPPIDANMWKMLDVYMDLFFKVAGDFELEQAHQSGKDVIAYKAIAALLEHASTMLRGKLRNYGKLIRERGRMAISHFQNWYTEDRWFTYDDEDGQEVAEKIRNEQILFPAKLTVVSGSTMPRSQIQEREEAIELARNNMIDQQALLKKLDFPGWKEIVKRMQAGPLGMFIEKLGAIGTPEELMQFMGEIAQMDDKEFEKAVEKGEIPSFAAILQAAQSAREGAPPPADPGAQLAQAELRIKEMEAQAKAQKMEMETRLTAEKIVSERVKQWQIAFGVQFDQQKLDIMRAEVMKELEQQEFEQVRDVVQTAQGLAEGPYAEKGLKSNNKA